MSPTGKKSSTRKQAEQSHRSTLSLQKTEVTINVYDLLPPGRLASTLWTFGSSLLHSGVVIHDKEYAYGGHDQEGLSGVYWTRPRTEPPGGTFRSSILHGFTIRTEKEIQETIKSVSDDFLGVSYNLLSRNCNHFTSALCENLTSRAAPSWLNRAASIGLALPCMVPRDWIDPPDRDSAEGMLLEETYHEDNYQLETSRMLGSRDGQRMALNEDDRFSHTPGEANSIEEGNGKRPSNTRDTSGRALPESERAPTLHEDA